MRVSLKTALERLKKQRWPSGIFQAQRSGKMTRGFVLLPKGPTGSFWPWLRRGSSSTPVNWLYSRWTA